MSDQLQRVVVPVERPSGGPTSSFWDLRDQLLRGLATAADFADVIQAARDGADTTFVAELPQSVLDAISAGDAALKNAKDGSGLLPMVFSRDGSFLKQVRLREAPFDGKQLSLMRGQMQTHLMLAQLIALVEEVDRKVQLVLAHQEIQWRGAIRAAVKGFAKQLHEPSTDFEQALTIVEHSLMTQLEVGWDHLSLRLGGLDRATTRSQRLWTLRPRALGTGPMVASLLDEVQTDLTHLAWGHTTVAEIHRLQQRPRAAAETVEELRQKVAQVADHVAARSAFRLADFSAEREAFWDEGTGREALLALGTAERVLQFEFTSEEVLCLTQNPDDAGAATG